MTGLCSSAFRMSPSCRAGDAATPARWLIIKCPIRSAATPSVRTAAEVSGRSIWNTAPLTIRTPPPKCSTHWAAHVLCVQRTRPAASTARDDLVTVYNTEKRISHCRCKPRTTLPPIISREQSGRCSHPHLDYQDLRYTPILMGCPLYHLILDNIY